MRDPLFRARTLDTKEEVFGYYVKDQNNNHFIYDISNIYIVHEIDEETLSLSCNLSDITGIMVFENDIIECEGHRFIIKYGSNIYEKHYEKGSVEFYLVGANDETNSCIGKGLRTDMLFWVKRSEVVGNIFDNSDLVEE